VRGDAGFGADSGPGLEKREYSAKNTQNTMLRLISWDNSSEERWSETGGVV